MKAYVLVHKTLPDAAKYLAAGNDNETIISLAPRVPRFRYLLYVLIGRKAMLLRARGVA